MDFHFLPAFAISLNEDLLFFLVFGIFALIKFLTSRKKNAENAAPKQDDDTESARRTREIQEEIRRRIAEAQGRAAPATAPQPHVNRPAVLHQEQVVKPSAVRRSAEADLHAAQRATRLYEQLEDARRLEAETRRKVAAIRSGSVTRVAASATPESRSMVEQMLRRPSGIKDAVILSEILSAPVSERRDASCPGNR